MRFSFFEEDMFLGFVYAEFSILSIYIMLIMVEILPVID